MCNGTNFKNTTKQKQSLTGKTINRKKTTGKKKEKKI